jgi:cytosine/adenosine deaminase-related metal-dependent hydrolase
MTDVGRRWYPLTGTVATARSVTPKAPTAAKKTGPIDPLTGPKLALAGRVVTMDDTWTVKPDAVLFIDKGRIVAVQDRTQPPPTGFERVPVVETGGTLFPGLIELHNHLSYNALPLWSPVPKRFEHRGQWPDHPDYRKLISGPMTVVGKYRDAQGNAALLAPLVRYVECKCLLGGTTTSQGIMLNSNAGVQRYYRGIIRNVERTDDVHLSEAQGRILDVDAKSAKAFFTLLNKEDSCYLLHLSEGITKPGHVDSVARKHFLALEIAPNQWALNDRFTGIHAAGLLPEDFTVLAHHGGSMVWSPLSNLLLYGDTARVDAAKQAELPMALGSDWSPSGSKNLLGELKVAWLYSQQILNGLFSAREVVAMATREPARILKWNDALGTLEAGKCADILVIAGEDGDPYDRLIHAKETAITLVMINGVARYGLPALMKTLAVTGETVRVGGEARRLSLEQATADPDVAKLSLSAARSALREALLNLPKLARELERPKPKQTRRLALDAPEPVVWTLALDEILDTGTDVRPRLPLNGPRDFTGPKRVSQRAAAVPLSQLLKPIALDPLTVADDPNFLIEIANQPNLPDPIRSNLATLY